MELGRGERRKEDDRASAILKYFTSVQVEDIWISAESCRIMGDGSEGVRESNRRA
jgi:hypothetical protein